MKSTNTFGVHFTLRRNKVINGMSPVYARITCNKTRVEISIKRTVSVGDWNEGKGCAKIKSEELRLLNSYLEEMRSKLVVHYQQLKLQNDTISAGDVKNAYLGLYKRRSERSLLWLIGEHNLIMEKVLTKGSIKNYYTTEKYVKKFLKERYSGDIELNTLNYSFLTSLEYYIRTTPLKLNDPCTNNGTMKHLERVKKMITWAVNNEWIDKPPFDNYKLKYKSAERESLNEEEFLKIEKAQFENPCMQRVKHVFIFSCYTGLSYIDVMQLQTINIISDVDGSKWLKLTRTKTHMPVDIPLLKPALQIIERYQEISFLTSQGSIFPYISNQEINRTLKMIAEVCGIKRNLTFHLARHTFATTVTLCNGVPIESISKMLGHSKLTTTMIYAKVVKTKLSMDMALLQKKLDHGR